MAFYKKRIVRPDTPADIAWRMANNVARDTARRETKEKFPVVTAENFQAANDYRERRIAELMKAETPQG